MSTLSIILFGRVCHRNIEDKILQISPILEAFGNAKTQFNDNSSRYIRFVELSFSKVRLLFSVAR